MAFINMKDFSIVSTVNDRKAENDYFECDDMIAPAISLLNRKGYKTTFCCSGHSFDNIDAGAFTEYPSEIPKEALIRMESSECIKYQYEAYGYELNTRQFPHYIVYKNPYCENFYVAFENRYEFSTLPDIFNYEVYNDSETSGSGIYEKRTDYTGNDTFEGITRVYEHNKLFYEWVQTLPSII